MSSLKELAEKIDLGEEEDEVLDTSVGVRASHPALDSGQESETDLPRTKNVVKKTIFCSTKGSGGFTNIRRNKPVIDSPSASDSETPSDPERTLATERGVRYRALVQDSDNENEGRDSPVPQTNPFFLPMSGSTLFHTCIRDLPHGKAGIYVVCRRHAADSPELSCFHQPNTSVEELVSLADKVSVIKFPLEISESHGVRRGLIEVSSSLLRDIDPSLEETNTLCLAILLLENHSLQVETWLRVYHTSVFSRLQELISVTATNQIFSTRITNEMCEMLWNIHEFDNDVTWYLFNSNEDFDSRCFSIDNKKYPLNPDSVRPPHRANLVLKTDVIRGMLTCQSLPPAFRVHLLARVMSSADYCHLVLNPDVLANNVHIINTHIEVFNHAYGILWSVLHYEECVSRDKIRTSDRYVVPLGVAHWLPCWAFYEDDPRTNPYFPLHISPEKCLLSMNTGGLDELRGTGGIVDIETFRTRLNLFMTGEDQMNLFKGLDWSGLALTGEAMSGILPLHNPLVRSNGGEPDFDHFFDKYYDTAVINLVCNAKSALDYVRKVESIAENVQENLSGRGFTEERVEIKPKKILFIRINRAVLREQCEQGKIPFDYQYIMQNQNCNKVKFFFHNIYVDEKRRRCDKEEAILGDRINHDTYFQLVKHCPVDEVVIVISKIDEPMVAAEEEFLSQFDHTVSHRNHGGVEETRTLATFIESYKYRIVSKTLKRDIEVSRISGDDFFSYVGRFEMPCDRSYYDGEECYLLPSAISSYMTRTNLWFQYSDGLTSPISIIEKYRRRGYGTVLNKREIELYREYVQKDSRLAARYSARESFLGSCPARSPYYGVSDDDQIFPFSEETTIDPILIEYRKTRHSFQSHLDQTGRIRPLMKWAVDSSLDQKQRKHPDPSE